MCRACNPHFALFLATPRQRSRVALILELSQAQGHLPSEVLTASAWHALRASERDDSAEKCLKHGMRGASLTAG